MGREIKKKCQTILALGRIPNEGIKSEELINLVFKRGDIEIVNQHIISHPRESVEEIEHNLKVSSVLVNIEDNGILLDFEGIHQEVIEPIRNEVNTLLEKSFLLDMREEVGTKKWEQEVLSKNNYKSKSIREFEKEVDGDNELLLDLKILEKSSRTMGIYERLKHFEKGGKIHTNFIPYYGLSGRVVSHSPSTQNFPSEWKNYLIPIREEEKVWELDIISAEILALIYITKSEKANEIIAKGDIYKYVISEIFGVEEDSVTKDQRKAMKKVINAINYGIGGSGIAGIINESGICKSKISEIQGWKIKGDYFDLFPDFKEYQKKQSEATELKTLSGHIFEVQASYKHIAFGPQNIIATLMKKLLIGLDKKGYTENIINLVHDSIWISSTSEVAIEIKGVMEDIFRGLVAGTAAEEMELTKLTELGRGLKND